MTEQIGESLGTASIRGNELFWKLPFAEDGGRLWLYLPGVDESQVVFLGIGSRSTTPPTQLYFESIELRLHPYGKQFDLPPEIENLFLGIRFKGEVQQIAVNYLWIPMGVQTPQMVETPVLEAADFKAPVDVRFKSFRFARTNEIFAAHSETEWRGELREDYQGFKSMTAEEPLAELDDASLMVAAELIPSSQQGYWTQIAVQNDSSESQDVALRVVTDEGEELKEVRTIPAGGATNIILNKASAVTGRVMVYAVAQTEVPLTLNTYYNYLLEVAAAA